jgi:hypothetical protein
MANNDEIDLHGTNYLCKLRINNILVPVKNIQNITLNNKPLLIDKDGNFTETLLLFPGYNVSVISANDKFKRTTEYKMELVYQDKE